MINIITVVCKTSKYRYLILEIKIKEIVDRDTDAWNNKDTEKLLSIFQPDMVWPWPRIFDSPDPVDCVFEVGRFDYQRWKKISNEFFKSHILVHNKKISQKIVIWDQKDGVFAVVDVDTLEKYKDSKRFSMERTCM